MIIFRLLRIETLFMADDMKKRHSRHKSSTYKIEPRQKTIACNRLKYEIERCLWCEITSSNNHFPLSNTSTHINSRSLT